jgi:hypothetical protein
VVQPAEQQDGVGGCIGKVKRSRVADGGSYPRHRGRVHLKLGDVQRHQVAVLDLVAERRKPQSVAAGTASDVRDDSGPRREVALHDFGCPEELELTTPSLSRSRSSPRS